MPVSGHQKTSVRVKEPSRTRWHIILIGTPSSRRRTSLRRLVASITTVSSGFVGGDGRFDGPVFGGDGDRGPVERHDG
ncbi:hypothetical protein BH23ACT2_BH23ACT2_30950 [soil metagenome]